MARILLSYAVHFSACTRMGELRPSRQGKYSFQRGFMLDELHEECGVIGIYNGDAVVRNITMGLYALQHRGQESAGFAISDGDKIRVRKSMGLVSTLLREHNIDEFDGFAGIGHVRYSTTGASTLANAQPILVSCKWGQIAVAHNGNITNANELRAEMEADGHIFQTTSDSEILLHEIARTQADDLGEAIKKPSQNLREASASFLSAKIPCMSPAMVSVSARSRLPAWVKHGALLAKPAHLTCSAQTTFATSSPVNF